MVNVITAGGAGRLNPPPPSSSNNESSGRKKKNNNRKKKNGSNATTMDEPGIVVLPAADDNKIHDFVHEFATVQESNTNISTDTIEDNFFNVSSTTTRGTPYSDNPPPISDQTVGAPLSSNNVSMNGSPNKATLSPSPNKSVTHHGHHDATASTSSTTTEVVWLFICFVGIMASFVAYGLLLEYTTSGGRKLHELSFLFVTSGLYTLTAAAGRYVRDETPSTIPPARFAILGLTSMGSTFCSVRSLR